MYLPLIHHRIFIMKQLVDYKKDIHSCSKCGLCQSVCPVYKITGNDCTVSRGHFIMLYGVIKGELKISKTINKYLDLCLKCNACSKFCPSGIDVVDIIALAKAQYFKTSKMEKLKSFFLKLVLSILNIFKLVNIFIPKSKKFDKKVIYFAGCNGINNKTTKSVIKILNSLNIEVVTPNFNCCGMPFFINGDMENFKAQAEKFYAKLEKYGDYDIVTNCASCEKTIKSYVKWFSGKNVRIKNVFEYIREHNLQFEIKKHQKVTYHKPCNLDNFEDVKWILDNTKNLEYVEMKDFDKCCGGLNAVLPDLKNKKILSKLTKEKHNNIRLTGAKTVLTSCLACKINLGLFSFGKYKVQDFVEFLAKNIKG